LPITALRETPIAAAIWLQVMPLPTQPRSCSMRSGVQVAVEVAVEVALEEGMLFGAGATIAESTAAAVAAIGGIAGDETGIDGAIDGDIGKRPRLVPRPFWAADRAMAARSGQPRDANLEAKIGARL
jgi:hypothetical protein